MLARDVMTNAVITVGPDEPLDDIAKLLIMRHISAVPVVDGNSELLGIVSEGDLVHRVRGDHQLPRSWWLNLFGDPDDEPREFVRSHGKTAKDVMTREVVTATEFTSIAEIAELLESKKIKRVPITGNGKVIGIVSRANIIQALVALGRENLPKVAPSDQEIREALVKEFNKHDWAKSVTLNVMVNDGVVRYWGFVQSEDAKDALRLAAENVPGVKGVEDNLGISTTPTDYI
jgi:CBS domain-containing protein